MNRERHLADSKRKYELYFNLLHSKMREHGVDERNTYNMDEKGFFVGINSRTKRIVSKAIWESKERTTALRDGNREWVTLLACVCASGEALPPALIYQAPLGFNRPGLTTLWPNNTNFSSPTQRRDVQTMTWGLPGFSRCLIAIQQPKLAVNGGF
jgi:hypothetical protein